MAPDPDRPPDESPDRDVLAGEYVLGLLEGAQARAVAGDPSMRGAVDGWRARLEPLAALASPVAPSEALWRRIARDLPRAAAPVTRVRPGAGRLAWRWLALGGYGLAAGLAVLLLSRDRLEVRISWHAPAGPAPVAAPSDHPLAPTVAPPIAPSVAPPVAPPKPAFSRPPRPQPAPPVQDAGRIPPPAASGMRAVALLTAAGAERPAMKAFFVQGGTVRLVAVQPVRVAADKALGFWVWPHGTALPIPLGRVDADGGTLRFPFHEADGTPVMVTLEPRQLPVSDAQGPTLFTGQLVAVE